MYAEANLRQFPRMHPLVSEPSPQRAESTPQVLSGRRAAGDSANRGVRHGQRIWVGVEHLPPGWVHSWAKHEQSPLQFVAATHRYTAVCGRE